MATIETLSGKEVLITMNYATILRVSPNIKEVSYPRSVMDCSFTVFIFDVVRKMETT